MRLTIFAALCYIAAAAEPPVLCGVQEPKCACFARGASNAIGVAAQFDFLWWRAENNGFSFALNENGGSALNKGAIVRVDAKWDPGFKLGFGWNSAFDRWDLFANWIWYQNHSTTTKLRTDLSAVSVSSDGYYPLWPVANSNSYGPYRAAVGSWRMFYNEYDLELGRAYFATPHLTFRPHYGVSGAWIHQNFDSSLTGFLQISGYSEQDFHGKNDWWGVGPRIGIHSDWKIGYGIRILGRAAASLLYGKTSVRFLSESIATGSSELLADQKFVDSFYALVPNLQLYMGVGWGVPLSCNRLYLGLDAGWEATLWWNQFHLPTSVRGVMMPLPTSGNQPVNMEGLTINMHLDF